MDNDKSIVYVLNDNNRKIFVDSSLMDLKGFILHCLQHLDELRRANLKVDLLKASFDYIEVDFTSLKGRIIFHLFFIYDDLKESLSFSGRYFDTFNSRFYVFNDSFKCKEDSFSYLEYVNYINDKVLTSPYRRNHE